MKLALLALLFATLAGCGAFRYVEFPNDAPADLAGSAKALRYLVYPGHGARGVARTPTVRWNRGLLTQDLGTLTRVVVAVTTDDGEAVWSASSGPEDGGWLLEGQAVRVFSMPAGAKVVADVAHAERGRLDGGRRYRLSLSVEGAKGKRIFEAVAFETEDAPLAAADLIDPKAP